MCAFFAYYVEYFLCNPTLHSREIRSTLTLEHGRKIMYNIRKKAICVFVFIVVGTFSLFTSSVNADTATCIKSALSATRSAVGNQSALRRVFDTYLGEAFAAHAARKKWAKYSEKQRRAQTDYARTFVVSVGKNLAKYADAIIVVTSISGNKVTAIAKTSSGNIGITAIMAGNCQFADIKVAGYPSLAEMIGDYTKRVAKNER